MLAFAANSLLCRAALQTHSIDPASFTTIRLFSGAIMLGLIASVQSGPKVLLKAGSWKEALALFAYAAAFSFAYVTLPAATGALILFGCVQATMITAGLARGERLSLIQSLGALAAIAGLVYLLAPGVHAPAPAGAALMAAAGIAWGFYSLLGRSRAGRDPTAATAGNFLRSVPLCLPLIWYAVKSGVDLAANGAFLALISGAITSGVGYAIWYAALKHLAAAQAAIVQLTVPAIAAAGAVAFLGEPFSMRLLIASATILGGVLLVLAAKRAPA
jgi:drug/metabolite transporter (DMT)-like permease